MAYRNLHEQVLELFAEEAPARLDRRDWKKRGIGFFDLNRKLLQNQVWRARNPTTVRDGKKRYREANRAALCEYDREYRCKNAKKPHKVNVTLRRARSAAYRARNLEKERLRQRDYKRRVRARESSE